VFDETAKEYSVLQINRDTMLEMSVLGIRGEEAGTYYGQLALAHTYGSGLADSSVNVKNTLMRFIHGLTVDYYITMNMDAIPVVNDAVGGVTVTVVDDFSEVNPSITKGEVTLTGNQVLDFVRTRKNVGDQKNTTRVERQQEYMISFLKTLKEKAQGDAELAIKLYDEVSPYIVTDCSAETLSSMLNRYMDYTMTEVISPEGESRVVDGYYEFYVYEDKFEDLVIDVFYKEKG
jgi:LCP family protein required for cell wall assembly